MKQKSKLNRRQFVRSVGNTSAVTVVGAYCSRSLLAMDCESTREDRPVFATIGLRNQGWGITQKSLPFADFAAICDVDSKVLGTNVDRVAASQGKRPDGYPDYRKILERKDIDAVMIATPDHWHTKIAVEAMLAGKHVYCEKPLTLTIDEGNLIERIVEKTGRIFQVGTMQRTECAQRFLQAIAMVRDGRIGKVKKVICGIGGMPASPVIPVANVPTELDWDRWLGPAPKTEYRALPEMRQGYGGGVPLYSNAHYAFRNWHEYSGGKLTDWGAHHVDIACWALGEANNSPRKVTPVDFKLGVDYKDGMPTANNQYNVATSFNIRAEMPNDVELEIKSDGDNGIMFEGTQGRFFVNRGKIVGKPIEDLMDRPLPDNAVENVYGGPVSKNHTTNFIEAIRASRQPISDVSSHNRMLEICHLANIAMRVGREIAWDADTREIIDDPVANSFLGRESRAGFEIEM